MEFLMKKIITLAVALSATMAIANQAPKIYLTTGSDAVQSINKTLDKSLEIVEENSHGMSVIGIAADKVAHLSEMMHEKFKRCGGFMEHASLKEALKVLRNESTMTKGMVGLFDLYNLDQAALVEPMVEMVQPVKIKETIEKLSSFHNRYYKSQTGVDSQAYLKSKWEAVLASRSDASVEFFEHTAWPQPSVIATITGSENPDEIIVIGGHADSISGYFGGATKRAPGADDNASGMATITEVMRVLVESNYQPKKTVMFMGYAAEEVGLKGSKEIAASFKAKGKNVIGVMQLDMTNFDGSSDADIVLMSDFTNKEQNDFLAKIIDTYVGVSWGWSKCGYACSDHASWTSNGYPASMPFESKMEDMNKKIHTSADLLENMRGNAIHASKFAKMAVAYMVELAK
jgi:bacterial leucyl aminopeptidase